MLPELGVDHAEKQRLVVAGEKDGWMVAAVRPPVGSAKMPRATYHNEATGGAGSARATNTQEEMVPEAGVDHGEKRQPMAQAVMPGGGLEPSAGSVGTPRAKRASNPQIEVCRRWGSNPHGITPKGF
ncbi:MAG: hypothetical protein LJE93_07915 [Acidobacteria bacterium]|nr:hypothetical protein [Acidobacteriota bacterium]